MGALGSSAERTAFGIGGSFTGLAALGSQLYAADLEGGKFNT